MTLKTFPLCVTTLTTSVSDEQVVDVEQYWTLVWSGEPVDPELITMQLLAQASNWGSIGLPEASVTIIVVMFTGSLPVLVGVTTRYPEDISTDAARVSLSPC